MTTDPDPTSAAPRRRRWPKRLVFIVLALLNVLALVAYLQLRSVENQFDNAVTTNDQVVPQLTPTVADRSEPITFLLIGSDSREGLSSLQNFGESAGERADVIILLSIRPDVGTAQMLSLPRDLYVEIPGNGTNKINSAFAFGGAPLMVETVSDFTDVAINHYVEVDFVGFQAIVDDLGGVQIDFPFPARDGKSGLDVDAGTQTLDGAQALAFARSRSYEELQGGSWVAVDADDFGRTRRQQQLIFAILRGLARPSSLVEMGDLVGGFAEYLTVDTTLAEGSLAQLALSMRNVRPNQIEAATLPGEIASRNGASVVIPTDPDADQILANLRAGQPMATFDPSDLKVRVLNGNGVPGSAKAMAERLESDGFTVLNVGDADQKSFPMTTILVRPDTISYGELIAGELGYGVVEIGSIGSELGAVVIVGDDDTTAGR